MSDKKRSERQRVDSPHNPYASPTLIESQESTDPLVKNGGMVARAVFGMWAGVLFGGTFGAGGSILLGITNGALFGYSNVGFDNVHMDPSMGPLESFFMTEIVAAIAGAICGLFAGGFIGPIVSVMTFFGQSKSRSVIYSSVVLSMVAGSAVGMFGSCLLARAAGADMRAAIIGVIVGSLSGVLGGFQLARSVISFANGEIS